VRMGDVRSVGNAIKAENPPVPHTSQGLRRLIASCHHTIFPLDVKLTKACYPANILLYILYNH